MHDGPPLAFLLLLVSWIPILALKSLIKEFRGKEGSNGKKHAAAELDQLRTQVESLSEQLEQLRNTSTGFDLSFDKRLSEIELNARLAKLSDAPTSQSMPQNR